MDSAGAEIGENAETDLYVVAQRADERAVTAHRMPEDALTRECRSSR
jgi:hypothetical protein